MDQAWAWRRGSKVHRSMGGEGYWREDPPPKPKWMRYRTHERKAYENWPLATGAMTGCGWGAFRDCWRGRCLRSGAGERRGETSSKARKEVEKVASKCCATRRGKIASRYRNFLGKAMRTSAFFALLMILGFSENANAETWKARNLLIENKSAGSCLRYKDGGLYTLDFTDGTFTASNVNGKMFSVKVAVDGNVKQAFISPSSARLEIVGNVKSRELETINSQAGCRWKLTPE
jgi:hypothetical protein